MRNLTFETKVFILILAVLMLGLFMINLIFIKSIRMLIEDSLRQEIINYQILIRNNIPFNYPEYLKITKNEVNNKSYILFEVDKPNYFYVNSKYFTDKLKDKIFLMIYWDFIILLVISLLYYFTVHKMISRERRLKNSFETILLIFSHKLRNYLSTQKINLELLRDVNSTAVARLENSYQSLNSDITAMENYIRNINITSEKYEEVSFKDFLMEKLKFQDELRLVLRGNNFKVRLNIYDFEFIIFLLLDNVSKYAKNSMYVRCGVFKDKKYFCFINDVKDNGKHGLGVGLTLAEMLCRKNGFKMRWKKMGGYFGVLIVLGK